MAASSDYFSTSRPAIRSRPPVTNLPSPGAGTPRTPLLGRSISSQLNSPGAIRSEQEDVVVYELGVRQLSAGFAGESRPRCVLGIGPEDGRRVGDYRQYEPAYESSSGRPPSHDDWGAEQELYRADLSALDLGLAADRFERLLRRVHTDYLQLDSKPRKALLVVPSLLPNPVLDVVLRLLFNHFTQPPSVALLTRPVMVCAGAGLRDALVVDVGWEETVVTAVGEYKEIFQRRTVRAGRLLARQMASMLLEEGSRQLAGSAAPVPSASFEHVEEVVHRLAWCRSRTHSHQRAGQIKVPASASPGSELISVPMERMAQPTETALFADDTEGTGHDDHDHPVPAVMYDVLLQLPADLRALCISRIIVTGYCSELPGLKTRLLQEIQHMVETRGWDPVCRYGSAAERQGKLLDVSTANISRFREQEAAEKEAMKGGLPLPAAQRSAQEALPHGARIHDDKFDQMTVKTERAAARGKVQAVKGIVRGVETLGAWSAASMVASLRVKGACEVEREDYLRHGLRDVKI